MRPPNISVVESGEGIERAKFMLYKADGVVYVESGEGIER